MSFAAVDASKVSSVFPSTLKVIAVVPVIEVTSCVPSKFTAVAEAFCQVEPVTTTASPTSIPALAKSKVIKESEPLFVITTSVAPGWPAA